MPGILNPLLTCFPFCHMAPRSLLGTSVKLQPDSAGIRQVIKWGPAIFTKSYYFPELAVLSNVNTYRPSLDLQSQENMQSLDPS